LVTTTVLSWNGNKSASPQEAATPTSNQQKLSCQQNEGFTKIGGYQNPVASKTQWRAKPSGEQNQKNTKIMH
jgi:hypothetical protein